MRMKAREVVAVALSGVISHPAFGAPPATHRLPSATHSTQLRTEAVDVPKLTIRVTPLVHLSRGDARGVVTVPRHADNRILRVILESTDYYSLSEIQLDGALRSRGLTRALVRLCRTTF